MIHKTHHVLPVKKDGKNQKSRISQDKKGKNVF